MNSLRRRNETRKRKRIVTITVWSVIAVFLIGVYMFIPSVITSGAHSIGLSVWQSTDWLKDSVDNTTAYFNSKSNLQTRNDKLAEEIENAELKLKQAEIIKTENEQLRSLWDQATSTEGLLALVVLRPPQSPYDMVTLNVGAVDGVEVGDHVIENGVFLGDVTSVYLRSSVVRLASTPSVATEGIIESQNIAVDLSGSGGGMFSANVPKDVSVNNGDLISHPSDPSMLIAEVVSVDSKPTDPFQLLRARSLLNLTSLRRVLVVESILE